MTGASGLVILLISLVCLGTWPALLDLSCLHGRHHPSHAYLDYATSVLGVAVLLATITRQQLFEASCAWNGSEAVSLLELGAQTRLIGSCSVPLRAARSNPVLAGVSVTLAAAGGCLLMLGNLSMQRALLMGVPLSIVLPMQGSLTVVLGTSINFWLQPERSHPGVLFAGVGAFIIAIVLSAAAHLADERDVATRRDRRRRKRQPCCGGEESLLDVARAGWSSEGRRSPSESGGTLRPPLPPVPPGGQQLDASTASPSTGTAVSVSIANATSASAGGLQFELSATGGLIVAAAGGVCFGFFSPAFNLAVNDELGWARSAGGQPLGLFAANLYFCTAFTISAWLGNAGAPTQD